MINNILSLADWTWKNESGIGPLAYSPFHIIWLIVMALSIVLMVYLAKRKHDKRFDDYLLLGLGIFLLITEIIKQIMYNVEYYHYLRMDVMPYALCSIPMYLAIIGPLVRNERIKETSYKFISFFGIIGGISAMLYPATLYTSFVYISIQTMVWHIILVDMAIYLIISRRYGISYKREMIPTSILFIILTLIAVGLNELTYHTYLKKKQTPVYSIDYNPASWKFYKYGNQSDSKYYLLRTDSSNVSMTNEISESLDLFISYPEGDNYNIFCLTYWDENDNTKYIEVNEDSGEMVLTINDYQSMYYEFVELNGEYVFGYRNNGNTYVLSFEKGSDGIGVTKIDEFDASTSIPLHFIDAKVERMGDSANFFFVSNHCETPIPVLSIIQKYVPYPIFVIIYMTGFIGASSLVFLVAYSLRKRLEK